LIPIIYGNPGKALERIELEKARLELAHQNAELAATEAEANAETSDAISSMAKAGVHDKNDEPFVKRASRFVMDQETGERVKRDVPVQFRRWWWTDASNGKTYIQLRYGNKPLDLAKDKPTIELKSVEELVPTLEHVHKAVADGELDAILTNAKKDRAKQLVRKSA
jgi:hypothetical protein